MSFYFKLLSYDLQNTNIQTIVEIQLNSYLELTVSELSRVIRNGDLAAETYAEIVVARALELDHLNAFTMFDAECLRQAARAADKLRNRGGTLLPLHGVPLAVKDNIDVRAFPTTAGTPALVNHKPEQNAFAVQSLLDNGAFIPAKTNMHEIAMGATNNNKYFGQAKNPYCPKMIPGGSSGGSAVAVSARILPGGLGTDTIGSVRIPASLCGLVGFRPSIGRYSQTGVFPLAQSRDTIGPMVRSVEDVVLLDSILQLHTDNKDVNLSLVGNELLKGLRLGVSRGYYYQNMDLEIEKAMETLITLLRDHGVIIVEADIPELGEFDMMNSFLVIFYEVLQGISQYLDEGNIGVTIDTLVTQLSSPDVKSLAEQWYGDKAISEIDYKVEIETNRPALQRAFLDYFRVQGVDAIIFPTTVQPAREVNSEGMLIMPDSINFSQLVYLQNTDPGSYAGLPGITLPVSITKEGLPIALGLDAPFGHDDRLLEIASAIESVLQKIPAPSI